MLQLTQYSDINTYITIAVAIVLSLISAFHDRLEIMKNIWWHVIILIIFPIAIYQLSQESGGLSALVIVLFLHSYRSAFTDFQNQALFRVGITNKSYGP